MAYDNSQLKSIIVHDVYVLLTIALLLYDHHNMIVFWSSDTNPENSVLI